MNSKFPPILVQMPCGQLERCHLRRILFSRFCFFLLFLLMQFVTFFIFVMETFITNVEIAANADRYSC